MEENDEESIDTIESIKGEINEKQDTSADKDLTENYSSKIVDKTTMSRRRWKCLAQKVLGQKAEPKELPKFFLFKPTFLPIQSTNGSWYRLTTYSDQAFFDIHLLSLESTTLEDLVGYNNTGNIRIWPSEECLAHYFLTERIVLENKDFMELGAGMAGLIGLAAYAKNARRVILTDGHEKSVANLKRIVLANNLCDRVECIQLDWSNQTHYDLRFDIIACADCLFFVDFHENLMNCIHKYLKSGGEAYIMAPNRNNTAFKFFDFIYHRQDLWESVQIHFKLPNEYSRIFSTFQSFKDAEDENKPILFVLRK